MNCPANPLTFSGGDAGSTIKYPNDAVAKHYGTTRKTAKQRTSTPEPHFIPGYTGHTPGYDENSLGQTCGRCSSGVLMKHRVAGSRLSRIPGDCKLKITHSPSRIYDGNPHETLQPHFVPGYTGFIPGSGIKRSEGVGQTYGRLSHILLAKHALKGGRLRPISEYPGEYMAGEEDVKFYCYEHELTRDDIKRWKDQVPGYTGHVPRAIFRLGRNKTKIAEESIAEFQKIIRN